LGSNGVKDGSEQAGANPLLVLKKSQLDKAVKDMKKHKKYPNDFRIELVFARTNIAGEIKIKELEPGNKVIKPT